MHAQWIPVDKIQTLIQHAKTQTLNEEERKTLQQLLKETRIY